MKHRLGQKLEEVGTLGAEVPGAGVLGSLPPTSLPCNAGSQSKKFISSLGENDFLTILCPSPGEGSPPCLEGDTHPPLPCSWLGPCLLGLPLCPTGWVYALSFRQTQKGKAWTPTGTAFWSA